LFGHLPTLLGLGFGRPTLLSLGLLVFNARLEEKKERK
jgi:hypothetical protein